MKNRSFLVSLVIKLSIVFLFINISQAQQVQWASKIIKMPSDLGGKQYGIKQLLGKPNAFPQAGSSPNAWAPKNALKGGEVLIVGFETPQTVKQVAVFENLNSGSVTEISVGDAAGNFTTVWTRQTNWVVPKYKFTITFGNGRRRKQGKTQEAPDVSFNPGIQVAILDAPIANISAVRVRFNFALTPGQKQIDAIGISDSDAPLEAKINTTKVLEKSDKPEAIYTGNINANVPILSFDGNKLYFSGDVDSKNIDELESTKIYSLTQNPQAIWDNPTEETNLNSNKNYNYLEACYDDFLVRGGKFVVAGTQESGYDILDTSAKHELVKTIKIVGYNNYEDTTDFTITADKKTILIAIESDFSQGGTDIYFATQKEDGTYNLLQNAGKVINSAADEASVRLLSDQKTLLFASEGFSGYGGFDIFVTQRLDGTWKNWSEPINLGSKINSNGFDGSPFYDEKNQILYFTTFENGKNVLKKVALPFDAISRK